MPEPAEQPSKKPAAGPFQPPRGTRDFYPIEMARRLWLEDKWRRTAVRHGFDEIDGPTFEHLDLYTVKSGEAIVNELFSFTRAGGETPFALRPEFTPTLARMVATKANALPKPIKWFSIGPYFRAERPQRGRLREFLQWNVDALGDPTPEADAEVIACGAAMLEAVGLTPAHVRIRLSNRVSIANALTRYGVPAENHVQAFNLLDAAFKIGEASFRQGAELLGIPKDRLDHFVRFVGLSTGAGETLATAQGPAPLRPSHFAMHEVEPLHDVLAAAGLTEWVAYTPSLARGLAYYTGTVFEVHETAGAERAIAGGGRYDNLVELFGGPPTPAVGFAMGDVVLSLVLQDKGLMPSDTDIARDLGIQPDAFVFAANDEADAKALRPLLAHLRREGLHARRSYKATRNVGKLLQDADKCGARFAVILESETSAKVKDLGAATRTDGDAVTGADVASLARAVAAKIPAK